MEGTAQQLHLLKMQSRVIVLCKFYFEYKLLTLMAVLISEILISLGREYNFRFQEKKKLLHVWQDSNNSFICAHYF
jgi:hypothetical protein